MPYLGADVDGDVLRHLLCAVQVHCLHRHRWGMGREVPDCQLRDPHSVVAGLLVTLRGRVGIDILLLHHLPFGNGLLEAGSVEECLRGLVGTCSASTGQRNFSFFETSPSGKELQFFETRLPILRDKHSRCEGERRGTGDLQRDLLRLDQLELHLQQGNEAYRRLSFQGLKSLRPRAWGG